MTRVVAIATLLAAAPAWAGLVDLKKIKKWPTEEQTLATALDAWMSDDEVALLSKLKTSQERLDFFQKSGYMEMWSRIREEPVKAAIAAHQVIEGMTTDEVYMAWDKPAKIRKDFRKDAYVDVLNYEFERDRKGREFLLRPDSQTAYKNEIVTRYVYIFDGKVFRVADAGSEEDIFESLPTGLDGDTTPDEAPADGAADEAPADGAAGEAPAESAPADGPAEDGASKAAPTDATEPTKTP